MPHRIGIVRTTLADSMSTSEIVSLIALATNARPPWTAMDVGCKPTSTCRVSPVSRLIRLSEPEVTVFRESTTTSRSSLLEVISPSPARWPAQLLTMIVFSSSVSLGSNGRFWTG